MATMDIFEGDAFSIIGLTRALDGIPFKPATLSGSGLFADRGVRSRTVVIESRDGMLSVDVDFRRRRDPELDEGARRAPSSLTGWPRMASSIRLRDLRSRSLAS